MDQIIYLAAGHVLCFRGTWLFATQQCSKKGDIWKQILKAAVTLHCVVKTSWASQEEIKDEAW